MDLHLAAPRHAHLVGIAGAGMRALAGVLLARGWHVSGSDLCIDGLAALADRGARLFAGHHAETIAPDTDLLICSDAVPADNCQRRRAVELGIPAISYFAAVGRLTAGSHLLAVAGTHGKSTTVALAAHLFAGAGRDPTVVCGATPLGATSGGRAGAGPLAIVEACEYRANFLHLRPRQAVLLGIEPDHFDCFPTSAELETAFRRFVQLLPADGLLIVRADCPVARQIAARAACRVVTFALTADADWQAEPRQHERGCYRFAIRHGGWHVAEARLCVPGRHNVLNALAAVALAGENGVPPTSAAAALAEFRGLHRRLELRGTHGGVAVVDDYAHHPTEVQAALAAVRQMYPGRRLWCVFQPHQASRTGRLLDELAKSLQNADRLAVADVFRAREGLPRPGEATADDLADRVAAVRDAGRVSCDGSPGEPQVLPQRSLAAIVDALGERLSPGDVLLTLGAGDVHRATEQMIRRCGAAAAQSTAGHRRLATVGRQVAAAEDDDPTVSFVNASTR